MLLGLKEDENCKRDDCVVHTSGGKGNCDKEGAVYQGKCVTCEQNGTKVYTLKRQGDRRM